MTVVLPAKVFPRQGAIGHLRYPEADGTSSDIPDSTKTPTLPEQTAATAPPSHQHTDLHSALSEVQNLLDSVDEHTVEGHQSAVACLQSLYWVEACLSRRSNPVFGEAQVLVLHAALKVWRAAVRAPINAVQLNRLKELLVCGGNMAMTYGGTGAGGTVQDGSELVARLQSDCVGKEAATLRSLHAALQHLAEPRPVTAVPPLAAFEDAVAVQLQQGFRACIGSASLHEGAADPDRLGQLTALLRPALRQTGASPQEDVSEADVAVMLMRADTRAALPGIRPVDAALTGWKSPQPQRFASGGTKLLDIDSTCERGAATLLRQMGPWHPPVVLLGPPGVGKSSLASAIARRGDMRAHYRDAVLWLEVGPNVQDRLPWLLEALARQLAAVTACAGGLEGGGGEDGEEEPAAGSDKLPPSSPGPPDADHYAAWIQHALAGAGLARFLLVLDDVRDLQAVHAFRDLGFQLLLTVPTNSRLGEALLGPRADGPFGDWSVLQVSSLQRSEASDLLLFHAGWTGPAATAVRGHKGFTQAVAVCRGVPEALSALGGAMYGKRDQGSWANLSQSLSSALVSGELASLAGPRPDDKGPGGQEALTAWHDHLATLAALEVSVEALPVDSKEAYLLLAILPHTVPATDRMLSNLWNCDSEESLQATRDTLVFLNLLQPLPLSSLEGGCSAAEAGRKVYRVSSTQMAVIRHKASAHLHIWDPAAARQSLFLGKLRVLKSAIRGRTPGGEFVLHSRLGLVSCWREVELRFGFTAEEAYKESLQELRARVRKSGGDKGSSGASSLGRRTMVAVLHMVADYLTATGAAQTALDLYRECVSRLDAGKGDGDAGAATSAQALKGMASCLSMLGRPREAEIRLRKAMAIEEGLRDPAGLPARAGDHLECAALLLQAGGLGQAEQACRDHLRLLGELEWGRHSPEMARCLLELAHVAGQQGKVKEAAGFYGQGVLLLERLLGRAHPALAAAMASFGALLCCSGKPEPAEALCRHAVEVWEKCLGPYSPEVACGLNNLGALLDGRGRHEEAETLLRRSLSIRQEVLPRDSLETAQTLNNLALALMAGGASRASVEALHRQALELREAALGSAHPDVAQSCHNLAGLLLSRHLLEQSNAVAGEARTLLDTTVAVHRTSFGVQHPLSQHSAWLLAAVPS